MAKRSSTEEVARAGEAWVIYKLLREGFGAVPAAPGAKSVDIYIIGPNTIGEACAVQVKGRSNSDRWEVGRKADSLADPRIYYALVDFGEDGDREPPDTFIVPSAVISEASRAQLKGWIDHTPEGKSRETDPSRRAIMESYPHHLYGDVLGCPDGWMEKYREGWQQLRDEIARLHG